MAYVQHNLLMGTHLQINSNLHIQAVSVTSSYPKTTTSLLTKTTTKQETMREEGKTTLKGITLRVGGNSKRTRLRFLGHVFTSYILIQQPYALQAVLRMFLHVFVISRTTTTRFSLNTSCLWSKTSCMGMLGHAQHSCES